MLFDQRLLSETKSVRTALILTIALGTAGGIVLMGQAFYLSQIVNRVFLENDSLADVQILLLALLGLSLVGLQRLRRRSG